jgi:DNA polymerase III delta subunit
MGLADLIEEHGSIVLSGILFEQEQSVIEAGQANEALRQLALMIEAGEAPEKILGQLGYVVRAKFPAIAADEVVPAIDAVFRTDVDLKRSAGDARILLERLVVEMCRGRRTRAAGRRW